MNTIHLHGAMAKRFGPSFTLHVKTPAEAIRAIGMQVPGFFEAVEKGRWRVVRGPLKGGRSLTREQLGVNLGGEMHLVAAPRGAGGGGGRGGGAGKVILGTLLVVAAVALVVAAPAALGAAGAATTGAASTATSGVTAAGFGTITGSGLGAGISLGSLGSISAARIAMFGAAMIFSGVSQMISPSPKGVETQASYLFSGVPNTSEQGGPVPLLLGKCRCGGVLISVSADVEDFSGSGNAPADVTQAAFRAFLGGGS